MIKQIFSVREYCMEVIRVKRTTKFMWNMHGIS